MNGKTRDWLWIIVGGYLTYTGVQLVMDVMNQKPEGYIGFVVAGVLFAVFGIGLIVYAIRNMTKPVEEPLTRTCSRRLMRSRRRTQGRPGHKARS